MSNISYSIFADFTTRVIIPNNDDGDLTYYKRRDPSALIPLIQGTGQQTQAMARPQGGRPGGRPNAGALPPGFTAQPNATPTATGFPDVQMLDGKVPAALGLPNTTVTAMLEGGNNRRGADVFQMDWIDACKGKSNNVVHGTSSKTHCDFDYAGTMMEQMLLGLVAHRAGKKLEYDPATGRVTNMNEANDYLKRTYRPNWKLNG